MDDTLTCPICGNKLRSLNRSDRYLPGVDKTADYQERTCSGNMNHTLQFFTDKSTNKVDLLKISLNPKYSRFVEIDFHNQRCRINCMKEGKSDYIDIGKMIQPDFPELVKLKEKVALFIVFS